MTAQERKAFEAMREIVVLMKHGAGQPFDHPDARILSKAGDKARAALALAEEVGK